MGVIRLERWVRRCGCDGERLIPPLDVWIVLTIAVGALVYAGFFVGNTLGWW